MADKAAKISELFEAVIENCRNMFVPSEFLSVDESTVSFHGRVQFRVFCQDKPDKYSMKIWTMADSHSGAILTAQLYTGKEGDKPEVGQGTRVVMDLVRPYAGSCRTVACDRFFTGVDLARELYAENLHLVGTIVPNRLGIPKDFSGLNLHVHYGLAAAKKKKANGNSVADVGRLAQNTAVDLLQDPPSDLPQNASIDSAGFAVTTGGSGQRPRDTGRGRASGRGRGRGRGRVASNRRVQAAADRRDRLARLEETLASVARASNTTENDVGMDDNLHESIAAVVAINQEAVAQDPNLNLGKAVRASIPQSAFLFSDYMTLIKYEPFSGKEVHMLSTCHYEPLVADDEKAKPLAILTYNATKPGVDVMDQMVKNYSTVRGCRRWTMRLFAWLLDIACLSSSIAYNLASAKEPTEKGRRRFLQALATALMKPLIRRREENGYLRVKTREFNKLVAVIRSMQRASHLGLDESLPHANTLALATTPRRPSPRRRTRDLSSITHRNRPRCYACSGQKKKTTRVCERCGNPVCIDHSQMRKVGGQKVYNCVKSDVAYCID